MGGRRREEKGGKGKRGRRGKGKGEGERRSIKKQKGGRDFLDTGSRLGTTEI